MTNTHNIIPFCRDITSVDAHELTQAIIAIKSDVASMARGLADLEKRQTEAENVRGTIMSVLTTQAAQKQDINLYKWVFGVMITLMLAVNGWQAKILYDLVAMHLKP